MIAATKIDATFLMGQFAIEVFTTPFRLDRNANSGGILVYVRNDIFSHHVNSFKFSEGIVCISFKVNSRKKEMGAVQCLSTVTTQSQDYLFEILGCAVDHYSDNYEIFILIGDFDSTET